MRILHLFNWKLQDITKEVKEIHEQGFDAVQIGPVQPTKECGYWWALYQPLGFEIGNKLGTKEDLEELTNEAHKYKVKVIVDVVCNHTANKGGGIDSLTPSDEVAADLLENNYYWKEKRNINNWQNRWEVTNLCMGLPGLRTDNYDLQDKIIDFLNKLIDCGADGFRFDAAKNIALPSENNCNFWIRVLGELKKKDLFNYAEVIFTPKNLIDEYCKYINVLTDSIGSDKSKLVTFVESHDSYLDDTIGYTRNMTDDMLTNEYRILCKNYPNTLFYARPFNNLWKSKEIKEINKGVL